MKLSNQTYDILKKISMIAGYIATFVLTLTDIWGFKYGAAVAATVSALGILLGSILTDSSKKYASSIEGDAEDSEDASE